jgi:hypothetical protein
MAYVYSRNVGGADNWGFVQTIRPTDRQGNDVFGSTVAVSGDWAIVGAYGDSGYTGAAYVFFRNALNQWGAAGRENQKLTADDGAALDKFGISVAIWSDTVVIGAPVNDSAYVFSRSGSTWQGPAKIVDAGGVSGDKFGSAVAVSGVVVNGVPETYILVGAEENDQQGTNSGKGFLFEKDSSGWVVRSPLISGTPVASAHFGSSASLFEQTALVGAYGASISGSSSFFRRQQK